MTTSHLSPTQGLINFRQRYIADGRNAAQVVFMAGLRQGGNQPLPLIV
jgi:hypothetical protein